MVDNSSRRRDRLFFLFLIQKRQTGCGCSKLSVCCYSVVSVRATFHRVLSRSSFLAVCPSFSLLVLVVTEAVAFLFLFLLESTEPSSVEVIGWSSTSLTCVFSACAHISVGVNVSLLCFVVGWLLVALGDDVCLMS